MTEQIHFHFSLSCIGEGNGNPLQCSCLENTRDGWAWWATVYGVAKSWTRLKRCSSSSRIDIAFLSRSKCILFSWLLSLSAVNLEPKKVKFVTAFNFFPMYLPWSDGTRCHDLSFLNVEFEASFFTLLFHSHQEALFQLWFPQGICPVMGLLGHMVVLFLGF